jgi:hypothetical protein
VTREKHARSIDHFHLVCCVLLVHNRFDVFFLSFDTIRFDTELNFEKI